jgi:hypothetical protein
MGGRRREGNQIGGRSMRKQLIDFYMEWRNEFLTVERFAEYHNITMKDAHDLIKMGKFYLHADISRKMMK